MPKLNSEAVKKASELKKEIEAVLDRMNPSVQSIMLVMSYYSCLMAKNAGMSMDDFLVVMHDSYVNLGATPIEGTEDSGKTAF